MSKTLILFDVDGTLTTPRKKIEKEMIETLNELKKKYIVGIVGGSDLKKQFEQLGSNVLNDFNFVFSENGLVAYENGKLIAETSIKDYLGEEKIKKFVNFVMKELADIDIPVKRGTFIEFRKGMFNISPIGRNCSQEERDAFEVFDKEHEVRKKLVKKLENEFGEAFNLRFSIGGQISFDVFPSGWDKTFCLRYVENKFNEIHFFGDKTYTGGNDYEIFTDKRTIGHSVQSYQETIKLLNDLFLKKN
jgi:phosphomannomutase